MKAVLISIQPKWCELIASGKKTVEVRKTRPKLNTPFKVYIYCTKAKLVTKYIFRPEDYPEYMRPDKTVFCKGRETDSPFCYPDKGNGKIIGECLCHDISEFESEFWDDETYERIVRVVHEEDWEGCPETESYHVAEDGEDNYLCRQSCLTWEELRSYVGQGIQTFFGWHISDLKIYDKPKELTEFSKYGFGRPVPLKRPPQSWMYVEDEICQ